MILAKKLLLIVSIVLCPSLHVLGVTHRIEGRSTNDSSFSETRTQGVEPGNRDSRFCQQEESSIVQSESDKGDSVANVKVHALTIDSIQFANIDKKGCIIDDYGTQIEGRYVKYLAQRIFYRALIPDTLITLDVKFFNPQGKLMRDADSPEGCSYRVSFRTASDNEPHLQYLGKLKAKFGKGYRMEIYDGSVCLASISVPTRGLITYVPIMMRTTRVLSDKYRRFLNMKPDQKAILFRNLHMRNYTGVFVDNYIITGWRAVEK